MGISLRRWLFSELKAWKSALIPGILVIAVVLGIRACGWLQPLEWMALDSLMRHRPAEAIDERVVLVMIDDEDIEQLKTYPISDREITATITKLQSYQPSAIAIDFYRDLPVEPGHQELIKAFQTYRNLFAIEQLPFGNNTAIAPPKGLAAEQVGFASLPLDEDGHVRRHLIGSIDPRYANSPEAGNHYKLSIATRLAMYFLKTKGISDDMGIADPETLRFGTVELPRVHPNTGAYIGVGSGGPQVLINYRSGLSPFRVLSLRQVRQNQFQPDWIRDKVILIGVNGSGVKDFVNVAAVPFVNSALYPGVKVHAHSVSQILAAVLNGRPFLQAWNDWAEYLWIIGWGILGIGIGRKLQAPWQIVLAVMLVGIVLVGMSYLLLLVGMWIPLVPVLIVFLFNGAGLAAGLLYRTKQELEAQDAIRQAALEQVFNSIHNRPLQQLSFMMRRLQDQPMPTEEVLQNLEQIDKELRSLRHDIGRIAQKQEDQIRVGNELLDLHLPLNELLQMVCSTTLQRFEEFPTFKNLKVRLIDIPSSPAQIIQEQGLSIAQKDWLCRFLEEAICNVGKHGIDVTRIEVFCGKEYKYQVIRVADNGINQPKPKQLKLRDRTRISGTQTAKKLERQLRGVFRRAQNQPQGMICELRWKAKRE
ncbi:MAG: CHASE2 domain-containing protein [Leptolyngbya sp. UWPOB_LEPTO1]|uniref:sensor histidine kinase n=1 Tax=Leptolyngbya sp. UWPOB_LEPTO1 TaxID=2815653 RepID=UPI001AD105AC|nr:CHASE2 domain-containing protein [Leptolyngbya sp. UWPOB_LEPTO1]MBN8564959.1 CHASE2 domain-containing protein [Leptolyngbya sp. UWPOB_LEPTO1]